MSGRSRAVGACPRAHPEVHPDLQGAVQPRSEVVGLLDLADRLVGACLARSSMPTTLSREQWRMLVLLSEGVVGDGTEAPGYAMGLIAQRAAVPAATATRLVDKLVAEGLAFRRPDPWDRRRVLVHLSTEGYALTSRVAQELDATVGGAFAGFDTDRAGIAELLELLEHLEDATGVGVRGRTV